MPRQAVRSRRGLLWVNHETSDEPHMFPGWTPEGASAEQVAIGLAAHGGSVVEIFRDRDGSWAYDPASGFNRRITATTPCRLSGPAAGHDWLKTSSDARGAAPSRPAESGHSG